MAKIIRSIEKYNSGQWSWQDAILFGHENDFDFQTEFLEHCLG